MKYKIIIIFFPENSFGGLEKTIENLCKFFLCMNFKIVFIISNEINNFKNNKNIKFVKIKNIKNLLIKNILFLYDFFFLLKKYNKKDTIVFSVKKNILSILVSKILGFKIVVRSSAPINYNYYNNFYSKIIFYIKLLIYSLSDLIISNSKLSADRFKKYFFLKKKTVSIPNPLTKFLKSAINNRRNKNLLYVGRISSEKGLFELVDGFNLFAKKYLDYSLLIIGEGAMRNKLVEYIREKNLNNKIRVISWKKNLNKYYSKSKILILPSKFEGFGNVLIEALNFNLPCIAKKNDGPNQILSNGKYGKIINDTKPQTICNAICNVLKNYNHYSKKAKEGKRSLKNYDLKIIGTSYLNAFQKI